MKNPELNFEIARAARALKHSKACINGVLKFDNSTGERMLSATRRAELQATCVILARAETEVFSKYELD